MDDEELCTYICYRSQWHCMNKHELPNTWNNGKCGESRSVVWGTRIDLPDGAYAMPKTVTYSRIPLPREMSWCLTGRRLVAESFGDDPSSGSTLVPPRPRC